MREELHEMMELCWRAKLTVDRLVVDIVKGWSRRVDNFLLAMWRRTNFVFLIFYSIVLYYIQMSFTSGY